MNRLIKILNDKDFEIDEKEKSILLTNDGINNVEKLFSNAGILYKEVRGSLTHGTSAIIVPAGFRRSSCSSRKPLVSLMCSKTKKWTIRSNFFLGFSSNSSLMLL